MFSKICAKLIKYNSTKLDISIVEALKDDIPRTISITNQNKSY